MDKDAKNLFDHTDDIGVIYSTFIVILEKVIAEATPGNPSYDRQKIKPFMPVVD